MTGIIWILLGVILLGLYNGLLLLDDKTSEDDPKNNKIEKDWHLVGSLIFLYLSAIAWNVWGWEYIPFTLSSFWLIFAAIVHKVALNKSIFFVGTTAKTDKLIRKYFPNNPEKGAKILKCSAFILSLVFVFLF